MIIFVGKYLFRKYRVLGYYRCIIYLGSFGLEYFMLVKCDCFICYVIVYMDFDLNNIK